MQSFAVYRSPEKDLVAELDHFAEQRAAYTSVFQLPGWADVLYDTADCFFVAGRKNGELNFFALVNRNGRKYFNIQFGPVCADEQVWHEALAYMRRLFRYKALCLSVQPDISTAMPSYGKANTGPLLYDWCTPVLDIDKTDEVLLRGFSENHRRAIKKAQKHGLSAAPVENAAETGALAEIYLKMYTGRGLAVAAHRPHAIWTGMHERFVATGNKYGIIFSVKKEDRVIGGIVITICGSRAFYYMGCSDPGERKVPILHLAFWEAIKYCRSFGISIFDFGGCNPYVKPGSQVFYINHFKNQFGTGIVYYPRRLYFSLIPSGTCLFHFMRKLKS